MKYFAVSVNGRRFVVKAQSVVASRDSLYIYYPGNNILGEFRDWQYYLVFDTMEEAEAHVRD